MTRAYQCRGQIAHLMYRKVSGNQRASGSLRCYALPCLHMKLLRCPSLDAIHLRSIQTIHSNDSRLSESSLSMIAVIDLTLWSGSPKAVWTVNHSLRESGHYFYIICQKYCNWGIEMIEDVNKIVLSRSCDGNVTEVTCKLIEDILCCQCPMDIWTAVSTERFLSVSEG